jgi:hypothetical protein
MNPIARSPFGPAAEQRCNIKAHAELVLLDENVKNLSKALVEECRKETAKYQHLAEIERDARREAEIRARSYAKVIDQHDDLKAKLESMIPDLVQEVQYLPKEPEVAELEAQLSSGRRRRSGTASLSCSELQRRSETQPYAPVTLPSHACDPGRRTALWWETRRPSS